MRHYRSFGWIGLFLLGAVLIGCTSSKSATPANESKAFPPPPSDEKSEKNSGTSEADNSSTKKSLRPKFDGELALKLIQKQCDFGPRVVGTPAHQKCQEFIATEMKKYADEVVTQDFKYRNMPLSNVAGVFYPKGSKEPSVSPIVILAHWDSRPIADGPNSEESRKNPPYLFGTGGWNRKNPLPAANDGASGVAVILELARILKEQKPNVGVILLCVDGEDYGDFRATGPNGEEGDGVLLGSRYFAENFRKTKSFGQPTFGILLDMVGAKNLVLPREMVSDQFAANINEKVFAIAQSLGYKETFRYEDTQQVEDDHVPLNKAGIPTIDLIHPLPFSEYETKGYRYWHTVQDTPDKCSAKSLKIVGETVAEVIYREK